MKTYKEKQRLATRQDGRIRDLIVDRKAGAPQASERVYVEGFGECFVHSCQPAGRDGFKLTVRKAA